MSADERKKLKLRLKRQKALKILVECEREDEGKIIHFAAGFFLDELPELITDSGMSSWYEARIARRRLLTMLTSIVNKIRYCNDIELLEDFLAGCG